MREYAVDYAFEVETVVAGGVGYARIASVGAGSSPRKKNRT